MEHRIIELYRDGVGTRQISAELGMGRPSITRILKSAGVPLRDNASRTKHLTLTPALLEILEGEILGDGCLARSSSASARFRYNTSKPAYLRWLFDLLSAHGLEANNIRPSRDGRKGAPGAEGKSVSYAELLELYVRWYPGDQKRIPVDIVITPTVLFHWYIGDGYLKRSVWRKKDGGKYPFVINVVQLATNGFSDSDIDTLVSACAKVGIHFTKVLQHGVAKGKGQYNMRLAGGAVGYQDFFDFIGPCPDGLQECYGYKWAPRKVPHYRDVMS